MKAYCVLLLALVALAHAQFDLDENSVGETISISGSPIRNGTVDDEVIGCEVNVHAISGAQVDDQPNTSSFSRSHWRITVINYDNPGNVDLAMRFYNGAKLQVPETVSSGGCSGGAGNTVTPDDEDCTFEYFCDNFFNGPFSIEVEQNSLVDSSPFNNYTLVVEQWIETVTVVGDRHTVNSLQLENRNVDGPFPSQYVHFYHVLGRDLSERGVETTFRARAYNFRNDMGVNITDGRVRLCIQTDHIVAEDETAFLSNNRASDCGGICSEDQLAIDDDDVVVEFSICDTEFDAIFLGVYTPTVSDVSATFQLSIEPIAPTVVPVTTITAVPYESDGRLSTADCDATNGNFTCEAYFATSFSDLSLSESAFDGKTGPYYSAKIHGIHDGTFNLHVEQDDFGFGISGCNPTGEYQCLDVEEFEECEILIPPCAWIDEDGEVNAALLDKWVATVEVTDVNESDRAFYGIDIDVFSMPETAVALGPTMGPFIDTIREDRYHHYSVVVPNTVTELDQLIVEYYARHESVQTALFWNYNDYAGQGCLDYQGMCRTTGHGATFPEIDDDRDFCRFQFIGCDTPFLTIDGSGSSTFDDQRLYSDYSNEGLRGLRVDTLKAGTYYFSVYHPKYDNNTEPSQGVSVGSRYYDSAVEYTLSMWFYEGAQELVLERVTLQHNFYHEYSRQFYIDMPQQEDDFTIAGLNIHVADVQLAENSPEVSAYWQCDKPAGDCPCWTNEGRHDFAHDDQDHHVIWFIPRCACPGRIYVSVENRNPPQYLETRPVGFTVLATLERNARASADLIDGIFSDEIAVQRYPEWAIVSALGRPATTEAACSSCLQYTFYRYVFDEVALVPRDTLVARLEFTPEFEDTTPEAWLFVLSSVTSAVEIDTCGNRDFDLSSNLQACRARANLNYEDDYWNGAAQEEWSFCQIVFQPCTAPSTSEDCYEENNDFAGAVQANREFDQSREWYAAVQVVPGSDAVEGIHYTLYTAVRSGVTALTSGVALRENVFEGGYNHYSIVVDAATASSNTNSLYFEFYGNNDQGRTITFYINRGVDALAGREEDCFESNQKEIARVCNVCKIGSYQFIDPADPNPGSCEYQVIPCDLTADTYYVSTFDEVLDAGHHDFFNDRADYTIVARIEPATELLGAPGNGHPLTGQLRFSENNRELIGGPRAHYTVTVPGSGDVSSRLRITVSSLAHYDYHDDPESSFFVTVVKQTADPSDLCRCPLTGRNLIDGNPANMEYNFERDNCDLNGGDVFFITIDGYADDMNNAGATRLYLDVIFTVHAELIPIPTTAVTLQTDNSRTLGLQTLYYSANATFSPTGPFSLQANEYASYTFTVSAGAGQQLNVRVSRESTNSDIEGTISYFLSTDRAQGLASANTIPGDTGSGSVGPTVGDSLCGEIDSCTFGPNSPDEYCLTHLSPCDFEGGTYFITLGGEDMVSNTRARDFQIGVSVFGFVQVLDVRNVNDTLERISADASNIDNDDLDWFFADDADDLESNWELRNGGHVYLSSSGSININAGEEVTFSVDTTASGDLHMYVSIGDPEVECNWVCRDITGGADKECTIVPCSDISGQLFIGLFPQAANGRVTSLQQVSFEVVRAPELNKTATLSSHEPGVNFADFEENTYIGLSDENYSWYDFTIPSFAAGVRYVSVETGSTNQVWVIDTDAEDFSNLSPDAQVVYPSLPDISGNNVWAIRPASGGGFERVSNSNGDPSCGTIEVSSYSYESSCCAESGFTQSFAMTGSSDREFEFYDYTFASVVSGNSGQVGINGSNTEGDLARDTANYHSFTVSKNSGGFYFTFSVNEDEDNSLGVEIFMNVNERAGPGSSCDVSGGVEDDSDFSCYNNLNGDLLTNPCNGEITNTTVCQEFIPISCLSGCDDGSDSYTVHLTVISQDEFETSYSFTVQEIGVTNGGSYPPSSIDAEDADDNNVLEFFTVAVDPVVQSAFPQWFPRALDSSFYNQLESDENYVVENTLYYELSFTGISVSNVDEGRSLTDQNNVTAGNVDNLFLRGSLIDFITDDCNTGGSDQFLNSGSLCENIDEEFLSNGNANIFCQIAPEDLQGGCADELYFTARTRNFYASYSYNVEFAAVTNTDFIADAGVSGSLSPSRQSAGSLPLDVSGSPSYSTYTSRQWSSAPGQTRHFWIPVNLASAEPEDHLRLYFRFDNNTIRSNLNQISIDGYADYLTPGSAISEVLDLVNPVTGAVNPFEIDVVTDNNEFHTCGDINNDDLDEFGFAECFVQFVPGQVEQIVRANSQSFWLNVDFGDVSSLYDNDTTYNFQVAAVLIDSTPLVPTLSSPNATLSETVRLEWTKEIYNYQWQFIEFDVPVNEGLFDTMTVTIDTGCESDDTDLKVFLSFDNSYEDVDRPDRVPSPQANVAETSGSATIVLNDCEIVGGRYRIAVYAGSDYQLFDDSDTELDIPASYSVEVVLTTRTVEVIAPECTYCKDSGDDEDGSPLQFRMPVEAENRGSQLKIWVKLQSSYSTSGGKEHVRVAHTNLYDHCGSYSSSPNGIFYDEAYEYGCSIPNDEDSCEIVIPECEFEQGYYTVFVDIDDSDVDSGDASWCLYSEFDNKHIPVASLLADGASATWQGQVYADSSRSFQEIQYYKVIVDDSLPNGVLTATLNVESCDDSECDLEFFMTRGAVGFSSDVSDDSSGRDDFATGNMEGSTAGIFEKGSATGLCHDYVVPGNNVDGRLSGFQGDTIRDPLCNAERNQYYIGVQQTTNSHCVYSLTVSNSIPVTDLADDVLVCGEVACWDFYRYTIPGFAQSFEIEITNGGDTDLRWAVQYDRIPFAEVDGANNACAGSIDGGIVSALDDDTVTFSTGCQHEGEIYVGIFNGDTNTGCTSCTDVLGYSVKLTALDADEWRPVDLPAGYFLSAERNILCDPDCTFGGSGVHGLSGRVFVNDNETDALTSGVSPSSLAVNTRTPITFTEDDNVFFFAYTPSTQFTVYAEVVDSRCTNPEFEISVNAGSPSFCDCSDSGDFTLTSASECVDSLSVDPDCDEDVQYITIWRDCDGGCAATVHVWVEEEETGDLLNTHTVPFTAVVASKEDCDAAYTVTEYVQVTDILSVSVKEPYGGLVSDLAPTGVVTATYTHVCSGDSDSCEAFDNEDGYDSSCRIGEDDQDDGYDARYSCLPAGLYQVDITMSGSADANWDTVGALYQIVNAWEPLTTVSTSIIGSTRHFYSVSTGSNALKIKMTVTQGPALQFYVFDGCDQDRAFEHHQVCYFGDCLVDVSTRALHSGADNFYVVITSGDLSYSDITPTNVKMEKATLYSLSAAVGSAACGARPSTGFCGSGGSTFDDAFTTSAFSIADSTWAYENTAVRDDMARCKYDSFVTDRCPKPDDECKRWLRTLACLEAFPACETTSGFLQGTCQAVCEQVECACGRWLDENNQPRPEYGCLSGRYQDGQTGSCAIIPVITPVPTPVPVVPTLVVDDTQRVHLVLVDENLINQVPGGGNQQNPTGLSATACSAEQIAALLFTEVSRLDTPVLVEQIQVTQVNNNEVAIQVTGSTFESADSLAVRIVNIIERYPDERLDLSCLAGAVANIEEPEESLDIFYTQPASALIETDEDDDVDDDDEDRTYYDDDNDVTIGDPTESSATALYIPTVMCVVVTFLAYFC